MQTLWRAAVVFALAAGAAANGDIIFLNVNIEGSLVGENTSFKTTDRDIDFFFDFPDGTVGDPLDRREGNISITYEAMSDDDMAMDQMILHVLGALSGSGTIRVNETIEDLVKPGVIATHEILLDSADDLPHIPTLKFDRPSTHIKVRKTFFLSAPDEDGFDVARVGLVGQSLRTVPEPTSLILLAMGGLSLCHRRRR